MNVPPPREKLIEERPCPTCGGLVRMYRDENGGLLFMAPAASLLIAERDQARRELTEATEKGAEVGWQAGYEFARKRLSIKGRLIGALLTIASPQYRAMRRREREGGGAAPQISSYGRQRAG
jgi:hypothetical protein